MTYLHGIEIKEITEGTYPIRVVNSAVIGVVGTAEKGPVNTPTLITSMKKAKDIFGEDIGGLTLISALQTIFDNGGATCIIINVADTQTLTRSVIENGAVKKVSGKWITKIYETAISGAGDFTAKVVAGINKLRDTESILGIKPKVLIAPGYSHLASVYNELRAMAETLRAKAIADMAATSVTNAITKRAADYNVSDKRLILCYPTLKRYNSHEGADQIAGLSQFIAAAIAARDADYGYWYSPSNYELSGITGIKAPISASISDENVDTNQLNSKGIITIFRSYGTGYRVWGNWTSAFPTDSNLTAMIAPSRVKDVLEESVQQAALNHLDKPISQAVIDTIKASVNSFINTLIGRGAIIDGSCTYEKEANLETEVAQGRLRFRINFAPSPSLDRLTFESFVDISLLKSLT